MIQLSPAKWTRALVIASIGLTVLSIAGQVSRFYFHHDKLHGLVRQFNLDAEANVPSWYQGMTLLACAVLLAVIAVARREAADRFARHWAGLAAIFAFMSLDELATFHEQLVLPARWVAGRVTLVTFTWIVPGVVFLAVLGAIYLRFLAALPARTRCRFLFAAAVYIGGAVGMEGVGGLWAGRHGAQNPVYAGLTSIEELMEMLGVAAFTYALLDYLREHHPVFTVRVGAPRPALVLVPPITLPGGPAAAAPAPGSPAPRYGRRP